MIWTPPSPIATTIHKSIMVLSHGIPTACPSMNIQGAFGHNSPRKATFCIRGICGPNEKRVYQAIQETRIGFQHYLVAEAAL